MPGGAGQDVLRLFFGLAAVAREAAKAGPALAKLRNGDVGGAAASALLKLVNAATDSSGLTCGTPRHPRPRPIPPSPTPEAPPTANTGSKRSDPPVSHWELNRMPDLPPKNSSPHLDNGNCKGLDKSSEAPPLVGKMDSLPKDSKEMPCTAQAMSEKDTFSVERVETSIPETTRVMETEGRLQIARRTLKKRMPRERRVPSTPLGRALGFAGLGAGLAVGTLKESAKRLWSGEGRDSSSGQSVLSPFLTEENAERLAVTLCRMRGAALKLGQMLSIQDDTLLPAPLLAALETVRQSADVMPRGQLETVLSNELGADWKSMLNSFDHVPLAAASIGQVHKAVLKNGTEVAMKIQYPGVANSINSDIENVKMLLTYTNFLPKGLYLDQAMKVAKEELARECDYELEARSQKRFRELLVDEEGVYVPIVVDELSRKRVLTTELVAGVPIDKVAEMEQSVRDHVGKKLLSLTLKELFVYRFMQTDPNWGNFLYDESKETINLIDFGAAREYPKSFVDSYLQMVYACANRDAAKVIEMSCRLGFLTGEESSEMLDAHTEAGFMVGLPFSKAGGFDFRSTNMTRRVSELGAVMLRHRLKAPPDEVYSLHRKLSGAFLACIKLGAVVPCREMLLEVYDAYDFSHHSNNLAQVATV